MEERTPVRLLEPLCALIATVAAVALIAFPTLSGPRGAESDPELADCLARLRTAVWHYSLEHGDADGPRHPAQDGDPDTLLAQLTGRSNHAGQIDDGLTTIPMLYGPYLRAVPTNPRNGRATIRIADGRTDKGRTEGLGAAGWVYVPETGTITPDGYWPNPLSVGSSTANR